LQVENALAYFVDAMTFSITTFSITTLSRMCLYVTLGISYAQHKGHSSKQCSAIRLSVNMLCLIIFTIMQSVVMWRVIAPFCNNVNDKEERFII
jgi:hypothetical protein